MTKLYEAPNQDDFARSIPINQYLGGGTTSTTATDVFFSLGREVEWVPAPNEMGFIFDGVWHPTYSFGSQAVPYKTELFGSASPISQSNAFPSYAFPYVYQSVRIYQPQILNTTILDTPQDSVTNPGILMASPSLYIYPGRMGRGDTGYACNHPTYEWGGSASWDGKKVSFASNKQYAIYYSVDGSVPSTLYTGSVSLNNTTYARFRFYNGTMYGPVFGIKITFDTSVTPPAPPAAFSSRFPTVTFDDWDDSGTSMPPNGWEADCGIAYRYTYGATSPASPTPQTKTGAAVGTRVTGRFLPTPLVSGIMKSVAYRYGSEISLTTTMNITVKIGKITASWDATNKLLTLSTYTTGATIKYSLDGSTPSLTYSAPLSINATTTVKFFAEKTGLSNSDTQTFEVTYDGVNPPADFTTDWYTALPSEAISQVTPAMIRPLRPPTIFVSPTGSGDGLTKSTPCSLQSAVNVMTTDSIVSTYGKAIGVSVISWSYNNGTNNLNFSWNWNPGITMYGGMDAAPNTAITNFSNISFTGSVFNFEMRDATGTNAISEVWTITKRTNASVDAITADWNATTKILTLSGIPSGIRLNCDQQATPTIQYLDPITVTGISDFKIKMVSSVGSTGIGSINNIDPNNTASFNQSINLTWTNANTNDSVLREPDVIWMAEGDYNCPNNGYLVPSIGVEIYGGFDSNYAVRDRVNNPTNVIVTEAANNSIAYSLQSAGIIDGINVIYNIGSSRAAAQICGGYNNGDARFQFCNFTIKYTQGSTYHWGGFDFRFGSFYNSSNSNAAHFYSCNISVDLTEPSMLVLDGQVSNNIYFSWSSSAYYNCAITTKQNTCSVSYGSGRGLSSSLQLYNTYAGCVVNIDMKTGDANFSVASSSVSSTCSIGFMNNFDSTINCNMKSGNGGDTDAIFNDAGTSSCWINYFQITRCKLNWVLESGRGGSGLVNARPGPSFTFVQTQTLNSHRLVDVNLYLRQKAGDSGNGGTGYSRSDFHTVGFAGATVLDIELSRGAGRMTPGDGSWGRWWDAASVSSYHVEYPTILHYVDDAAGFELGNPIHIDTDPGMVALPWFSGTPTGKGAPINGYTVARGGQTQYGRYWET